MSTGDIVCALMFADIAGSTGLYDEFGDTRAQKIVTTCLDRLTAIATEHGGVRIKTIGDEIMCRFPAAENAVEAACDMHERLAGGLMYPEPPLAVRIGIHYGKALVREDDLYGDAVNVCARMTDIARGGQIITTEETIRALPPPLRGKARRFDRATVRGRTQAVDVYQVLWESGTEVTRMMSIVRMEGISSLEPRIRLAFEDVSLELEPGSPGTLIGRDPTCQLVVPVELASRHHARIEYSNGKFVLFDQSTNGTYVRIDNDREVWVRHEALPLYGSGIISLGRPCGDERHPLIHFECD